MLINKFKKYIRIYFIQFRAYLTHERGYRLSMFLSIVGSFVFVIYNLLVFYLFVNKFSFPGWNKQDIWVLLGSFMMVFYSYFYFFYKGIVHTIKNVHSGKFDYFLLKPADTQLISTILGGGIHNLLAVSFGIILTIWAILRLTHVVPLVNILLGSILAALSAIDLYSILLIMTSLSFRYGNVEDITNFVFSFQLFSRYPIETYNRLPLFLWLMVIPFSALASIPAITFSRTPLPLIPIGIYVLASLSVIGFSRYFFYRSIRHYTSGN